MPPLERTSGQPARDHTGNWHGRHSGIRFPALFLILFTGASLAWAAVQGTALERFVIEHVTVNTSARLINLIRPEEKVRAEGPRLVSSKARLSVLNGCDGTETILLLVSAIIAFPAPWQCKPVGLLIAAIGAFTLNQLRLASLYFTLRFRPGWFEAMHGLIAPALIIALGSVLFIAWIHWAGSKENERVAST